MLDKQRGESTAAWTRILYLVTRADVRFNVADVDAIKARLQQTNIHLCVIGAHFPASPLGDTPLKPEASIAWSNVAFWRDLLQALPQASFVTPTQAVHEALAPHVQLVKSSPQNTVLTFGDPSASSRTLAVPVQILKATAAQRPMGQQKVAKDSAEPANENEDRKPETKDPLLRDRVDVRRRFYRVDDVVRAGDKLEDVDPLPEHSQETFERAYKLGASIVPLSEALEQEIETQQGLEVLHFVHADTYRREYSLGEVSYVVADPKSVEAQLQLSSVVRACMHRNVYALCRLVSRRHSDPKVRIAEWRPKLTEQLCMLAPFATEAYDAFYMVRVPFRDDVRRFAFPPLDRITTRTGEELRAHKTIPNAEQQACMDELVDAMDLTNVSDEESPDGWYTPRKSYNPAIHGVRNAVALRVLYPERSGLPELLPQLRRYLSTPSSVEERAREPRRAGMDKFGIQPASRMHRQGDAQKPDEPQKRRRADAAGGDETPDESDTESFATAEQSRDPASVPEQINVTGGYKIRLEDPVSDFEYLVHDTDAVSEACAAMQRVVYALLRSGRPREELYPLLARCLYAYRVSAAEVRIRSPRCVLTCSLTRPPSGMGTWIDSLC